MKQLGNVSQLISGRDEPWAKVFDSSPQAFSPMFQVQEIKTPSSHHLTWESNYIKESDFCWGLLFGPLHITLNAGSSLGLALKGSLRHCLNLEDYPWLQTVPFGTSSGRRHFPGGMILAGTEAAKGLLKRSIMAFWHYHSGVLRYNEARKASSQGHYEYNSEFKLLFVEKYSFGLVEPG